jgi:hypothetical protein
MMMRKRLTRLCFANYFTILFSFALQRTISLSFFLFFSFSPFLLFSLVIDPIFKHNYFIIRGTFTRWSLANHKFSCLAYCSRNAGTLRQLLRFIQSKYLVQPLNQVALCLLLSLFTTIASAQVTITLNGVTDGPNNTGATQFPNRFVVGAGTSRVTYTLTNNTGASVAAGTALIMDLPNGGSYAGSPTGITSTGGTANVPTFTLNAAIPAGGTASISYLASFDCSVIAFINGGGQTRDIATLGGTTLDPPGTYNVVSAALSIIGVTNPAPTQNVGTSYMQTVTIRNGGINSIVPTPVTLNLGTATGTTISAPSIGTLSGNNLTFSATDIVNANLSNDDSDNQWENGEDLTVTYTVTVNNCINLTRSLTAYWGDGTSTCQTSAPFNTGVTISNLVPNLNTSSMSTPGLNACPIDVPLPVTLTIRNTGTGPANVVSFEIFTNFGANYEAPSCVYCCQSTGWGDF